MSSMRYSVTIDELTVVIIAADASTRHDNAGMGRSNPYLRRYAIELLTSNSYWHRHKVHDMQVIADAVWYDHFKPKLIAMLDTVCQDRKHSEAVLNKHFSDEGITYRG